MPGFGMKVTRSLMLPVLLTCIVVQLPLLIVRVVVDGGSSFVVSIVVTAFSSWYVLCCDFRKFCLLLTLTSLVRSESLCVGFRAHVGLFLTL